MTEVSSFAPAAKTENGSLSKSDDYSAMTMFLVDMNIDVLVSLFMLTSNCC